MTELEDYHLMALKKQLRSHKRALQAAGGVLVFTGSMESGLRWQTQCLLCGDLLPDLMSQQLPGILSRMFGTNRLAFMPDFKQTAPFVRLHYCNEILEAR